jgi:type II secretion system (T2SS) protein C
VRRHLLLLLDGILLVTAAFLGVRLYQVWGTRLPTVPAETPPAASAEAPASPAAVPPRPPLTTYAAVAERNLFSSTRTEAPPEPPRAGTGTSTPAPPAPKPRLYGIVLLPEGRGRAYLEDVQRRRVFAYSVGDLVGDARLEQIKSDRVVLRRGGETFEVLLYDPTKPRQSAAPSSVQSPEAGGRPAVGRPPGLVPSPVPVVRPPGRPRVAVPPPAPPQSGQSQEQPTEEE